MTTTTTRTTTRDWLTMTGLGCLLLGGIYATPSCIIPGDDPRFVCGIKWSGIMQAAHGEKAGTAEAIKEEDGSWVTWHQCMVDDADVLMTQAEDAHCHLQTTEMSCDGTAGCVWTDFAVDGRVTEVCLLDNPDYEDVFRYYVENLIARCNSVAVDQSIEPYPCEGLNQAQCNSKAHCTFNAGTCTFDFDTCTSSAVKAVPAQGTACTEPAGQCENPLGDDPTGGQQSLPPPSQVITTINSTTWEIDADFWAWITEAENQPLLLGQSARIVPSGSDWKFTNVATNTYVYAMGLRTNDILWEINGQSLQGKTLEQVEAIIGAVGGASAFTFKVKRGTVIRTHTYVIIN